MQPIPGVQWYRNMNRLRVERDLRNNPEIKNALGEYYKSFIRWAANQRFSHKEDIMEEYNEYIDMVINKRLYNIDIDLWKK